MAGYGTVRAVRCGVLCFVSWFSGLYAGEEFKRSLEEDGGRIFVFVSVPLFASKKQVVLM